VRHQTSATTTADPERLWEVVSQVELWPEWIEVYEEVRRARGGDLTLGESAHVKQRGLRAGEWTVTELEPGSVFAWESRQPGVRILGRHVVSPDTDAGSRLTLQLETSGWLSPVVGALLGRKICTYVDLECARLTAVATGSTAA
jgi:hypothetical protein